MLRAVALLARIDGKLRRPRGAARGWGQGRSRAAAQRRAARAELKRLRWFGKLAVHALNYGVGPALYEVR